MSPPTQHDAGRFAAIERAFHGVCDLPPEQRRLRLDELCAGDDGLRRAVLALLEADADSDSATILDPDALVLPAQTPIEHPSTIGPFEIVRVLGEGGMGVVYEAIQRVPNRRVALKVIRERVFHERVGRRFESEADILAKLNHPGIATIYESGVAEDAGGQTPYVVMELIDGEPITEYAHRKRLSVRQRLRLIAALSEAVGYMHRVGIVHRDLKPSNVLVDAAGRVKVLDFGIALDLEPSDHTRATQAGQLLGTLKYMAPEQLDHQSGGATPASDVYAIGMIAYELLAGVGPLDRHESSMYELVRAIREDDPPSLGSVDRSLKGDPEIVVAKALDKVPSQRYPSAGQLGEDIERLLGNLPIHARRPSVAYQLTKFSRRNPVIIGSAGVLAMVTIIAFVLIANALRIAARDRDVAKRDQRIKELVNGFTTQDLYGAGNPMAGGDPEISLLDAMREASAGIGERFAGMPEVEAEIRAVMGEQFALMNHYPEARAHLERTVELSEQLELPAEVVVRRRNALCSLYMDVNELDRGFEIVSGSLAILAERGRSLPELEIDTLVQHASLFYHAGQIEQAAVVFERAIEIGRSRAPEYEGLETTIANLATVYTTLRRFDEALPLHLQGVRSCNDTLGQRHPETMIAVDNLGSLYIQMERYEDAQALLTDLLGNRLDVFGPDHVKTQLTRAKLATALSRLGRHEEGEGLMLAACAALETALGPDHRYTVLTRGHARKLYERWGKPQQAERFAPRSDP